MIRKNHIKTQRTLRNLIRFPQHRDTPFEILQKLIHTTSSANMSAQWNQCFASCPASTVTIQPPPFVLTIPGPALYYCPDQPFGIEQYNPCARMVPYHEGGRRGGYSSFYSGPASGLSSSSIYSKRFVSRSEGGCNSCQ
ncbi:scale keratin-like [Lacerta agilis]|uniref:scale keratin-like n=1 Tax=Lacerta agilis TaxID=80427 RepID=UPI00141924DA|nr:scale keratin-like [Lacerta agilis]